MTTAIDPRTMRCLRIALTIYQQDKNGSYWLKKATETYAETHNNEPPNTQAWQEVRTLIASEFPELITKYAELAEWITTTGAPQPNQKENTQP